MENLKQLGLWAEANPDIATSVHPRKDILFIVLRWGDLVFGTQAHARVAFGYDEFELLQPATLKAKLSDFAERLREGRVC